MLLSDDRRKEVLISRKLPRLVPGVVPLTEIGAALLFNYFKYASRSAALIAEKGMGASE